MFATQCACGTMQHAITWVCRVAQSAAKTHVFGWIGRAPIAFVLASNKYASRLHVSSILPEIHPS